MGSFFPLWGGRGFLGFRVSLKRWSLGLGLKVRRYKPSSRQGLRESLGCRLVRVDGIRSALGLEPAFKQGLGLGVGFKVWVKVNKNRSMPYYMACVGLA